MGEGFNDVSAQMAKHFKIKEIKALCAVAIDLRKAAAQARAASAPASETTHETPEVTSTNVESAQQQAVSGEEGGR